LAIELVIFDCDGVLFSSEAANVGFYNEVLSRAGLPALEGLAAKDAHALASAELFKKHYSSDTELLERLQTIAKTIPYTPFFDLMTPMPGLREVLSEVRGSAQTAIATNRGKTVDDLVERFELDSLFDLWVGVLDVEKPKPAPDLLLLCLEHFGVAADSTVYVGDQQGDLAAAAAAGVHFVGMPPVAQWSERSIGELTELPAHLASL
jgi:phosphoglycolate phosphatase